MTSNVTYAGINSNFPVAGQDNDTKVFRDNFATIKSGLENAYLELSALQGAGDNASGAASRETDNNFNGNDIRDAVLWATRDKTFGPSPFQGTSFSFGSGAYQIWQFPVSRDDITLVDFPGDPAIDGVEGCGKIRLELYSSDTDPKNISFITTSGTVIKRSGFPDGGTDAYRVNFVVSSNTDPVIIDVWRRSRELIFVQYVGQFA